MTVTTQTEHARSSAPTPSADGKTVIADVVIAKIIGIAVREVRGVHDLGGAAGRAMGAIRDVVGNTDLTQGVDVEVGEKQVAADVTLVADYPVRLQRLADEVRAATARAIGELVGLDIAEINVTVNDVHLPGDGDDGDSSEGERAS